MTIYTIQAHIIYISCKLYLYIENNNTSTIKEITENNRNYITIS